MPKAGPQQVHLPLHREFLESYNESAILLGFHPSDVLEGTVGGKLPITIYESNYEAETQAAAEDGEDKEMMDAETSLSLKFKVLQYTVETGEAEMISVAYIARGGNNSTAVETPAPKEKHDIKLKNVARPQKTDSPETDAAKSSLTSTEDEMIAALVAKANAVKMLQSRIDLIVRYLQSLPPSYIDSTIPEGPSDDTKDYMPVDPSVLRSIYALLSRLSLIVPSGPFEAELLSELNDVSLINLLSSLTASVKEIRETGKKFAVVESGRQKTKGNDSNRGVMGGALGSAWDDTPGLGAGAGDLLT